MDGAPTNRTATGFITRTAPVFENVEDERDHSARPTSFKWTTVAR
jgi:hypothetical protein